MGEETLTTTETDDDPAGTLAQEIPVQGVRGHAVCVRGDDQGADSVAIWHVSASGALCGAWTWPWPTSSEDAQRALSLVDGRLLVSVDPELAVATVAALAAQAGIGDRVRVRERVLCVQPEGFRQEIADFHAELQAAFEKAAATRKSKLVPPDLPPLPGRLHGDLRTQMVALGVGIPADTSEVISQALGTARLVKRLVELWQGAENQRMRRSYMRTGSESRPLGAGWLDALRQATTQLLLHP